MATAMAMVIWNPMSDLIQPLHWEWDRIAEVDRDQLVDASFRCLEMAVACYASSIKTLPLEAKGVAQLCSIGWFLDYPFTVATVIRPMQWERHHFHYAQRLEHLCYKFWRAMWKDVESGCVMVSACHTMYGTKVSFWPPEVVKHYSREGFPIHRNLEEPCAHEIAYACHCSEHYR